MQKVIGLKRLFILAMISFICGIAVRTTIVNMNQPEFMFYRTLEPQFALASTNN